MKIGKSSQFSSYIVDICDRFEEIERRIFLKYVSKKRTTDLLRQEVLKPLKDKVIDEDNKQYNLLETRERTKLDKEKRSKKNNIDKMSDTELNKELGRRVQELYDKFKEDKVLEKIEEGKEENVLLSSNLLYEWE